MGTIFMINVSNGGLPKRAVQDAMVTGLGILDDHQRASVHGGPDKALCLYSLEKIQALQAEGHPIFPGAIGENLTLAGMDWSKLVPGIRLQLGQQVRVEITSYTVPCNSLVDYFIEADYSRVSQTHFPGWARLYARVLQPGRIRVGDAVDAAAG
jgi:MOSC domain-containing protein YiiM